MYIWVWLFPSGRLAIPHVDQTSNRGSSEHKNSLFDTKSFTKKLLCSPYPSKAAIFYAPKTNSKDILRIFFWMSTNFRLRDASWNRDNIRHNLYWFLMACCEMAHWPHPECGCLFSQKRVQLYATEIPSRVNTLRSFTLLATTLLTITLKISATIPAITRRCHNRPFKMIYPIMVRPRHKFRPRFLPILSAFLPFALILSYLCDAGLDPDFFGFLGR